MPSEADRPRTSPAIQAFRLPQQAGAWWTFGSAMLGGLWLVLSRDAADSSAMLLAVGMGMLFLSSDWAVRLLRAWRENPVRAKRLSGSFQGQALVLWGLAAMAGALPLAQRDSKDLGFALALSLAAWFALLCLVLALRLRRRERDPLLLAASAALMAAPAHLLAGVAFHDFGRNAILFWGLQAWSQAAGVYYLQVWMRGGTVPENRLALAALPFVLQAGLLWGLTQNLAVAALLALLLRFAWRQWEHRALFARLHAAHAESRTQQLLPTDPDDVHALAMEHLIWNAVVTVLMVMWVGK